MDGPIFRSKSFSELKGLTVVMPCYKEDEKLVTQTYCELALLGAEVIVVDDGGYMDLVDEINVVRYKPQMGYGYAIKEGIKKASNPVIATIDGDQQHGIDDVCKLYTVFKLHDDFAMVVGSRWNLKEDWHRWFARKCLNFLASCISGHYQIDLNSGMRIFRRELATGYSTILCDTFSFTTSLTMSIVTDGHKIAYFPITVRPRIYGKSRVKLFKDGLVTLYYIVWVGIALRTRNIRKWMRNLLGR